MTVILHLIESYSLTQIKMINKDDIENHEGKAYCWSKYVVKRLVLEFLCMEHSAPVYEENASVLGDGEEHKEAACQDVSLQVEKASHMKNAWIPHLRKKTYDTFRQP